MQRIDYTKIHNRVESSMKLLAQGSPIWYYSDGGFAEW
jgi:hypothetical protein